MRHDPDYLEYLSGMVGSYPSDILEYLLNKEFVSEVERDRNRADWALVIREGYLENMDPDAPVEGDCSVLEVLIHLSMEADFQAAGTDLEMGVEGWFWHILNNIGLNEDSPMSSVRSKIGKFLNRTYRPNGVGGAFPLRRATEDCRQLELWDQLSAYILENTDLGY